MADKNKNKKLDPEELESTVEEEEIVNKAFTKEHVLGYDEINKIDTFEELEEEAKKIEEEREVKKAVKKTPVIIPPSKIEKTEELKEEREEKKPSLDLSVSETTTEIKKEIKEGIAEESREFRKAG